MALERLEFGVKMFSLGLVHEWIYLTLRSITSPVFNEFAIWILPSSPGLHPRWMNSAGWKVVDMLLDALAKRNPDFRVVIMEDGGWSSIASYLPLATSKGLISFGLPDVENLFSKMDVW